MKKVFDIMLEKRAAQLAVLIDPDNQGEDELINLVQMAERARVDFFFVGGSLLLEGSFERTIATIKLHTAIPVVIFPGNNYQISKQANAILMLSLLSGRNADYLIGQHVVAAPQIKKANLETISTGYLLIDGGRTSTTAYMTQTIPIPRDRPDIVVATAMAGEMLGMKLIYLEAGSGANHPVSGEMISAVRKNVSLPLIVGGGIKTPEQAEEICQAGADIIVLGNILEKEPSLLIDISLYVHANNQAKP